MCHRGAPVLSLPLKEALERFLDFLGAEPVVLFGHNCKRFDCPVLFNAAKACGRLEDLQKKVAGFVDTLPLFREGHRGLKSYKQELLYEHYFQESYSSHDAAADALALERLVKAAGFSTELTEKNLFCFEDIRV
nr:hypothetical protein BaRGS_015205 [Batillaria attramentaria]